MGGCGGVLGASRPADLSSRLRHSPRKQEEVHLSGRCWTQVLRLRRASSGRPLRISQERKRTAWEYVLPDGCSKEKRARSSSLLWKKLLCSRFPSCGYFRPRGTGSSAKWAYGGGHDLSGPDNSEESCKVFLDCSQLWAPSCAVAAKRCGVHKSVSSEVLTEQKDARLAWSRL